MQHAPEQQNFPDNRNVVRRQPSTRVTFFFSDWYLYFWNILIFLIYSSLV